MRALLPLALLCALLLPATSAGQGDESSKTADQMMADMTRDLGAVHSYHVEGTARDKSGTSTLVGDVDASGRLRVRASEGNEEFAVIATKSAAYVRANREFWRREGHVKGKKTLKLLSGRWIKVPGLQDIPGLVEQLAPATLGHCLSTEAGTITKRGTTTFQGRHVIVLAGKGDKPRTAPGLLYLTSAGRILPVREVQTGRRHSGGQPDPQCGDTTDTSTTHSDIRLSRFDKPVQIAPPAHPLDLSQTPGPRS
jgi:hypothetical protein